MKLVIQVDYRERPLLQVLEYKLSLLPDLTEAVTIVTDNLAVGDIIITCGAFTAVFERKTMTDWAASIKDGRLHEQKARLLSTYDPSQLYYIIENGKSIKELAHCPYAMFGLRPSVYIGSLISMLFKDRVHVIETRDLDETVQLLIELAGRIIKDPVKFQAHTSGGIRDREGGVDSALALAPAPTPGPCDDYLGTLKVKTRKVENITPNVCYQLMLCQIPGISVKIASTIVSSYPTLMCLLGSLMDLPVDQRIEKLISIPCIGKKKALLILQYLTGLDTT